MITGELKNKIDHLWEIFWTGGITNPLDVIEQITYLMFICDLDIADDNKRRESQMLKIPFQSVFGDKKQDYKWSVFKHFAPEKMYKTMQEGVFPFIKNLHADKNSTYSKYMSDAIFKIPTPQQLEKIVSALDDIMSNPAYKDKDMRGDVWLLPAQMGSSARRGILFV